MAKYCKKIWKAIIGLGFAACGTSKILGASIQEKRFSEMNWSKTNMRLVGALEVTGASMLLCKKTTKLGALIMLASTACLFSASLKHKRKQELALDSVGIFAALSLLRCKKN